MNKEIRSQHCWVLCIWKTVRWNYEYLRDTTVLTLDLFWSGNQMV